MDDQRWFDTVAALMVAIVLVGSFLGLALLGPGANPPTRTMGADSGPTAYRNLTIHFVPSLGGFAYSASQFEVPLHIRVVFTITNFDGSVASTLPTPADSLVVGTYGGTMGVDYGAGSVSVSQLSPSEVSHTFSLSDAYYHVNVPIPSAASTGTPVRVTFSVVFDVPGTYAWGCVVLCGSSDMTTFGSMDGTLTVA